MSRVAKWVNRVIVIAVIAALIALVVTSILVRDYRFIVDSPVKFTIELIAFSVLPSLFVAIVLVKTRNIPVKDSLLWFLGMLVKFAIFHVLLQLSGVYTILFERKILPDILTPGL